MAQKENLNLKRESIFKKAKKELKDEIYSYNKKYMDFLDESKTERLFSKNAIKEAEKKGFRPLDSFSTLKAGDKVYSQVKNKALILFVIGEESIENGLNIVASHIDSPRLDLKPQPLYESDDIAYFKTHYYGGIKKYQWVTQPLALYGTVVKKDGKVINIAIGEKEHQPVFCISDLLVHLAAKQMQKKANEVVTGENLNLIVGSIPVEDDKVKTAVKEAILKELQKKYDITEADFESAEFEAVPASKARDVGFDSSMVGAYAQDDRVCSYAALEAILKVEETPKRTACIILADKEEIGSYGNTGLQSRFFENELAEICVLLGVENSELSLRRALKNSACLSADVTGAFDPSFPDVFDKTNSSYLGQGVAINKYGGSRGKSGSNDAHPEFLAKLRDCLDSEDVAWQTGELGKVDVGGGGTVAFMLANYGMDVVDCGTPVLSMHSPFELTSKADTYMTYKAYLAFLSKFD